MTPLCTSGAHGLHHNVYMYKDSFINGFRHFQLASCRLISEQQRVYGRGERAYETDEKEKGAAGKANKDMKNMDKVSHVFRLGDYNDIGNISYLHSSVCMLLTMRPLSLLALTDYIQI